MEFKKNIIDIIKNLMDENNSKDYTQRYTNLIYSIESPGEIHNTSPGEPNLHNIKSTTETAFQRAIYNKNDTTLKYKDGSEQIIEWIDLEIPVSFTGSQRRKCVDLIGMMRGKPFICEIKFAAKESKYKSDRTEYGIVELMTYYYLINYYTQKHDASALNRVLHNFPDKDKRCIKWSTMNNNLILIANNNYWEYWFHKRNLAYKDKLSVLIKTINEKLGICISLFEAQDINFKKQSNNKDTYSPELSENVWHQVL